MAQKISVQSLGTPDKDGFLTKQGGSIKTWKKRYFILKGNILYYFKSQKDSEQTGQITLETTSRCQPEPNQTSKKKGKYYFSVHTTARVYSIWADSESSMNQWVDKINAAVENLKGGGKKDSNNNEDEKETVKQPVKDPEPDPVEDKEDANDDNEVDAGEGGGEGGGVPSDDEDDVNQKGKSINSRIESAKSIISFLNDESSKVLEFWEIWSESIPPKQEITSGSEVHYQLSTSSKLEKLTWKSAGPQSIFIQRMVDFFWNVGAPESEIDRLNDVGASMNPSSIGSWIDMSDKGGMDGGWYFPIEVAVNVAIEACDEGEASTAVVEWANKHNVENCFSVGRDMGAAPPRQTELRFNLSGDYDHQLEVGLDAFELFGFPSLPENALEILNNDISKDHGLSLSVITSSEGFVRIGLLCPNPSNDIVKKLCSISDGNYDNIKQLEKALEAEGPLFAEFQFLKEGFGYGVYKEGFDIIFHYSIGIASSMND
eukprot:TRINITY_DN11380_c0_g1_i1.p1 TRINITY_DN11380_c0_g1~~TRINITY_DN11380_c0_g1_i1.p1  ORF type:complete len:487 (-),score=196.72 TRINITY_DN11380_c0_g1_i1:102-1562(-)